MSRSEDFVSFSIAGQLFGIPVLKVQDVLASYKISRIPLAPPEIMGQLNLRGRVVTAIDIRRRIGLSPRENDDKGMSIVVENDHELYRLDQGLLVLLDVACLLSFGGIAVAAA